MNLDTKKLKELARVSQLKRQASQRLAAESDKHAAKADAKRRELERNLRDEVESRRIEAEAQLAEQKRRRDSIWTEIIRSALKREKCAFIRGIDRRELEFIELLRLKFSMIEVEPVTLLYTNLQSGSGCVVNLDGVDKLVHTVDGYSLKWIRWLCSDRGHSFFERVSEKVTRCAEAGQSYEVFLGTQSSFRPAPTATWETYRADRDGNGPWTPFTYYVNDVCIASRGPDPKTFRLFLEVLGLKCTSRKAVDGTAIKVSWA
jgi:hypothetical protein